MIYLPSDIKWIKNITNSQNGSAYMDKTQDDFILHYPNQHKGNVTQSQIGDIILLYQRINKKKVFTHLVTPVDNILYQLENGNHNYGRKVKILAFTPFNDVIQIDSTSWKRVNFSGVSQGNACRIDNIESVSEPDILRDEVWNLFKSYFLPEYNESIFENNLIMKQIENESPELTYMEGKQKLVQHISRERNKEIVNLKKEYSLRNNNFFCEVCGFSFIKTFEIAFIECHHIIPISESGERNTKIEDLALVCPNCHRMLHKRIEGNFLSIHQLRLRIKKIEESYDVS